MSVRMDNGQILNYTAIRFGISSAGVMAAAALLISLGNSANTVTVALAFILVVLSAATFFGRNPALLASFLAMLCFNYFFLPPLHTWHISDPQNLIAWAAFTITAIVAGELSAYARRRAEEAERLYEELQQAFKTATEAEALKQSEKLKSALLDAVTHDLRTPLTSIKASVTTLLDSEGGHRTIELDSEGRTDFLDVINEETDRLNGFIESMVQLARVEAGSVGDSPTPASIEEIVSIALNRAEAITAGHRVTVDLAEPLPSIQADERAIAEVIYNLIENAAKYSQKGTGITISSFQRNGKAVISVMDEGKGIAPDMREKVFDKFVRLENAGADGLGLGLAISRGIIEAQDGWIEIRTGKGGRGTEVVVELALKADE